MGTSLTYVLSQWRRGKCSLRLLHLPEGLGDDIRPQDGNILRGVEDGGQGRLLWRLRPRGGGSGERVLGNGGRGKVDGRGLHAGPVEAREVRIWSETLRIFLSHHQRIHAKVGLVHLVARTIAAPKLAASADNNHHV